MLLSRKCYSSGTSLKGMSPDGTRARSLVCSPETHVPALTSQVNGSSTISHACALPVL